MRKRNIQGTGSRDQGTGERRPLRPAPYTLLAVFLAVLITLFAGSASAEVKLKIAVVNPSSTEKQVSPIRYDLPKGIGPDQVWIELRSLISV